MSNLTIDTLDNGAAVVNVGTDGGYVMVEQPRAGWVLITVINDEGDVLMEQELNTTTKGESK